MSTPSDNLRLLPNSKRDLKHDSKHDRKHDSNHVKNHANALIPSPNSRPFDYNHTLPLTEIEVSNIDMTGAAVQFFNNLNQDRFLKKIKFNHCLRYEGIRRSDIPIVKLDIGNAIARYLQTTTSLTELQMNSNLLGLDGIQAIIDALKMKAKDCPLETIDLDANLIENENLKAFAELLEQNSRLRRVCLDRCSTPHSYRRTPTMQGDYGYNSLAYALLINKTLTEFTPLPDNQHRISLPHQLTRVDIVQQSLRTIKQKCMINRLNQNKLAREWGRIAIVIASMRAHRIPNANESNNPRCTYTGLDGTEYTAGISNSILALVPEIIKLAGLQKTQAVEINALSKALPSHAEALAIRLRKYPVPHMLIATAATYQLANQLLKNVLCMKSCSPDSLILLFANVTAALISLGLGHLTLFLDEHVYDTTFRSLENNPDKLDFMEILGLIRLSLLDYFSHVDYARCSDFFVQFAYNRFPFNNNPIDLVIDPILLTRWNNHPKREDWIKTCENFYDPTGLRSNLCSGLASFAYLALDTKFTGQKRAYLIKTGSLPVSLATRILDLSMLSFRQGCFLLMLTTHKTFSISAGITLGALEQNLPKHKEKLHSLTRVLVSGKIIVGFIQTIIDQYNNQQPHFIHREFAQVPLANFELHFMPYTRYLSLLTVAVLAALILKDKSLGFHRNMYRHIQYELSTLLKKGKMVFFTLTQNLAYYRNRLPNPFSTAAAGTAATSTAAAGTTVSTSAVNTPAASTYHSTLSLSAGLKIQNEFDTKTESESLRRRHLALQQTDPTHSTHDVTAAPLVYGYQASQSQRSSTATTGAATNAVANAAIASQSQSGFANPVNPPKPKRDCLGGCIIA